MISIQKKFLFIHIPKTGGNSIQNILQKYSDDKLVILGDHQDGKERFEVRNTEYPTLEKHSTLTNYKGAIKKEVYASLFKFATIRNPWDMMISYFFSPHRGVTDWNRQGFLELLDAVPTFSHFTKIGTSSKRFSLFKKKDTSSQDTLDFVIRFEHLDEDFKKLCTLIDIPYEALPKRNQSKRNHYSIYYDDELIQKVAEKFSFEIAHGAYTFEKN